jgi:hypothetical protein
MTVSWHPSIFALEAGVGLAVCVSHAGAHVFYLGGCQALQPAQPKRLRAAILARSLDREHRPEPARVEIDADALALGIAGALHSLMRERREQRATSATAVAPEPTSDDREPTADLPDVEVWTDNGASG